jgi:hypothetical protein
MFVNSRKASHRGTTAAFNVEESRAVRDNASTVTTTLPFPLRCAASLHS